MNQDLTTIRDNIDEIDNLITSLFEKRMGLTEQVAKYKKQTGKAVRDNAREAAIIDRITHEKNQADKNAITLLYKMIFEISRARQDSLLSENDELYANITTEYNKNLSFPTSSSVACQGVEGAYSQIACSSLFKNPSILYFENFKSVFQSVESGLCKYGVLPFENSIHGSVTEVYDMLSQKNVSVVRSVKMPINHVLLSKEDTSFEDISEIFSHKQAIAQCSDFLEKHKNIKVTACENTAIAAKMVSESNRNDIAAICSESCAKLYNLKVMNKNLQNSIINYTMFYCISKNLEIYPDVNKTAFMFNTENKSGSLFSVLARLAAIGVNLTKIESRPISGKDFEFMFYAEADINGINRDLFKLFDEFKNSLNLFKFIGAYNEIISKQLT